MAGHLERILQDALRLPESERAELAGRVIDNLDAAFDEDAEEAWEAESARRVAELDRGEAGTIPWPELQARLLSRLDDAA